MVMARDGGEAELGAKVEYWQQNYRRLL